MKYLIVNDEEDRTTFTYSPGSRADGAWKAAETISRIAIVIVLAKNEGVDLIFTLRKTNLIVSVLNLIELYFFTLALNLLQRMLNLLSNSATGVLKLWSR